MLELFLGILCGVALSLFFSFGPAFFSQIRTSIQYGFRKSYPFAVGVSLGDIVIVFLMLTVLKNYDLFELLHNVWVASIGGGVIVAMGIYFFCKKVTGPEGMEGKEPRIKFREKGGEPRRRTILMQGFFINFVNPTIWIYWISVITLITGEFQLGTLERYEFFFGVLGSTLGLDILKCKLASLLQRIITAKVLNTTNKICSLILFIFAGYLIISMILYQTNPKTREREHQPQKSTELIKNIHNKFESGAAHSHPNNNPCDTIHDTIQY